MVNRLTDEQLTAKDIGLIIDVLQHDREKLACVIVIAVNQDKQAEVLTSTGELSTLQILSQATSECAKAIDSEDTE